MPDVEPSTIVRIPCRFTMVRSPVIDSKTRPDRLAFGPDGRVDSSCRPPRGLSDILRVQVESAHGQGTGTIQTVHDPSPDRLVDPGDHARSAAPRGSRPARHICAPGSPDCGRCRPIGGSWRKATAEQTWPIEHYREIESLEERWQPYVYFRPKPFHGKTITIGADGLARHLAASRASREAAGRRSRSSY